MSEVIDRAGASSAAVKHRVFAATREAIVGRRLAPGTKLTEDVIAETFGCGRGAVRWALARLGDEGLVTLVPNRGAFVAEPPLAEAMHLFGARRILEGGIVRCLCDRRPTTGWQPLIDCVEAEDQAHDTGDEPKALRLSGDFHLIMADLTDNPVVSTMLRELVSRTILAISVHQRAGTSGCRTHEHRRLIRLLQDGDVDGAAREMDAHLSALERGLDLTAKSRNGASLRDTLLAVIATAAE